jgi:hypothetical protein
MFCFIYQVKFTCVRCLENQQKEFYKTFTILQPISLADIVKNSEEIFN